jgi:hypothetical protein
LGVQQEKLRVIITLLKRYSCPRNDVRPRPCKWEFSKIFRVGFGPRKIKKRLDLGQRNDFRVSGRLG